MTLLTTREVARRIGVPEATLRYWRHRNHGEGPPSFRLGPRRVVYAEDKLVAWVEAQEAAEFTRRHRVA
jgi:prophage regulatory protein